MTDTNAARRASNGATAAREQVGPSPRCRDRVVGAEPTPDRPLRPSIAADQATHRCAGLPALLLLCAFIALPAIAALVLLADEEMIGGFLLLGLALACLAFLLSAISRESSGPLGHRALAVGARAQLRGRVVCASVRAWSRAGGHSFVRDAGSSACTPRERTVWLRSPKRSSAAIAPERRYSRRRRECCARSRKLVRRKPVQRSGPRASRSSVSARRGARGESPGGAVSSRGVPALEWPERTPCTRRSWRVVSAAAPIRPRARTRPVGRSSGADPAG
jgi:hypothetical protein